MAVVIYLIVALAIIALYVMYVIMLFYLSAILFPLGSIILICVVLYNYLRTMWTMMFVGEGWKDSPEGPEPAFRQYYFRKAYHDYSLIVGESWKLNRAVAQWVISAGTKLFTNSGVLFTWPLGVTFFLIAGAGSLVALVAYGIFGLVHLLLILLCAAVALAVAALFRFIEYVSMLWRRIFLVCPNAGCYKRISLPVYLCPNCGAQHNRLIPGTYGIARRRCRCGAGLPTLFLFGRNSIPSICPHEGCRRPLSQQIGMVRNLHIPIVSGPSTGKTSFLMANLYELQQRAEQGVFGLEFPEKKSQRLFDKSRENFSQGRLLDKTAEDSPDAFLFNFGDADGHQSLLYMYDAAGEVFQQIDVLRRHEFYEYTHGILFLMDPFSLPQVKMDFAPALKFTEDQIRPSPEAPQDVYDRVVGVIRERSKMGGRFAGVPVAVVVTKADAFDLAKKIGGKNGTGNGSTKENSDPQSGAVRGWLQSVGEGNLVRSIERDFKKVRYFYCSALGRLPDNSSSPFIPDGVLAPLTWLLTQCRLNLNSDKTRTAYLRPQKSAAAPKVVKSFRSYDGKLISVLWILCIASLIYTGSQWVFARKPWLSLSRPVPAPAPSSPTPRPTIGRTGMTTTDLNLRISPTPTSTKIGLAERSSRIQVLNLSADNTWYEIKVLQHGRPKQDSRSADHGWVNSKYLSLDQ